MTFSNMINPLSKKSPPIIPKKANPVEFAFYHH
ncbi:Clp protease [Streptococcus pseudopneumoniae]|nr:Clp protease [Streptococcus pseudopneumoniae]NIB97304.1 Clp protease [Streptococcus pseudopneumoniae]TMR45147.1 Clp protease [Streptococcus pseudopneumoniae]TMR74817.1 Clp protease [Streptococcus pseudopneumoniae]